MICPKCGGVDVLAERSPQNGYRRRHYSVIALVLDFLGYTADEVNYRENGPFCQCVDCGYKWRPKQAQRQARYRQILTQKLGAMYHLIKLDTPDGCVLALTDSAVVLGRPKGREYTVPYDEIAAVGYHGNLGPLNGWLTVRNRAQAKRSLPENFKQAKKDRQTVLCCFGSENSYYQIYLALQEIVEENGKAGLL